MIEELENYGVEGEALGLKIKDTLALLGKGLAGYGAGDVFAQAFRTMLFGFRFVEQHYPHSHGIISADRVGVCRRKPFESGYNSRVRCRNSIGPAREAGFCMFCNPEPIHANSALGKNQ
jgi:hypothetical protein